MIRKSIVSLILMLAFTCSIFAQDKFVVPEQKIIGADKVIKLGKLVRLKISDVVKKPENYVSSTYAWKVYDTVYDSTTKTTSIVEVDDVEDAGNHIFFGAGVENKKLIAQCIISHIYTVKDKDGKITEVGTKLNIVSVPVTIGAEPAPPGPGPDPNPTPVFPDGRFKLAGKAYEVANTSVVATNRKKGVDAVSSGCKSIASAIAAGTLVDPTAILKELKSKNNNNLVAAGVDITEWDNFGIAIQAELLKLYKNKQLNVAADYADALLEISSGLDKVK